MNPTEKKTEHGGKEECRRGLFRIDALAEARKNLKERMNSYNDKYFKKFAETGKAFSEDVKKDASEMIDRMVEAGRKIAPKLPFAEKLEKAITDGVGRAASRLNIPRRDDVERLSKAIESLNEKVGGLSAEERRTPKK